MKLDPKKDLSVEFAYIDNRDTGFLYLSPVFPPPIRYDKETREQLPDEHLEQRKIMREKFSTFFSFEQIRTKQGKDAVAKWTAIYLKKLVELQAEVSKGLIEDLPIMTTEDVNDAYWPDTDGIGHRSKQTY